MSPHPSIPTSLLHLPPELRQEILTALFQSIIVNSDRRRNQQPLAVLRVCRQLYREAAPLALPNVRVYCHGNAAIIDTLTRIGPARIAQLRHLIISHMPIGFRLDVGVTPSSLAGGGPSGVEGGEGLVGPDESGTISDLDDYEDDDDVRFFHAGALLGLFPGLQLDRLEVFSGVRNNPFAGGYTTDCFTSLLEADGYRQLWMEALPDVGGMTWIEGQSTEGWKSAIERGFKPHVGWRVQIALGEQEWSNRDRSEVFRRAREAGITLVQDLHRREVRRSGVGDYGGEEDADIVVDRGKAAVSVVKAGDDRVLRCMQRLQRESPRFFRKSSDALRKLFRENSWGAIKAGDGYAIEEARGSLIKFVHK